MDRITKFADAWKLMGTKHDWFWCKKKPVIIKAIQMDKDFEVETLEGVHKGRAGDYLLQGIRGEVYPCRKDIFEETYRRQDGKKHKKETEVSGAKALRTPPTTEVVGIRAGDIL